MTPGTADLTITMVLSSFSSSGDNTRLIRYRETLYKLKILLADDATLQQAKELKDSFHAEVEEVVRAVVFLVENKSSLVQIQTEHFHVVPSLLPWKLSQELGFRQDGKELKVCKNAIILTLTCGGGERAETATSGMAHPVPQESDGGERAGTSISGTAHPEPQESHGDERAGTSISGMARSVPQESYGGERAGTSISGMARRVPQESDGGERAGTSICGMARPVPQQSNGGERAETSASGTARPVPRENLEKVRSGRHYIRLREGEVVERGEDSFQQRNKTVPAALVIDVNNTCAESIRVAPPTSSNTVVSHIPSAALASETTANRSATNAATSETVANFTSTAASSHIPSVITESVVNENSSRGIPAASEPACSRRRVTHRGIESKGQNSVESSKQGPPSKTSSRLSTFADRRSVKDLSVGHYNLRETVHRSSQSPKRALRTSSHRMVQHSSQSPKTSLRTRLREGSFRASAQKQNKSVCLICAAKDSAQAGGRTSRAGRRIKEHTEEASRRNERAATTFSKSASPGNARRTRQQLTFSHSGATFFKDKDSARRHTSAVFTSSQLPSKARSAQHTCHQPAHNPSAGRPSKKTKKTVRMYQLRHSINRSTVLEEQRLKELASHQNLNIQDQSRQMSTRSAVQTFEQKDRHMVEMGDIQEELKLQNLASCGSIDVDKKSDPRGTKRNSSLSKAFSDTVVAPIKRALRAYTA